MAKYKVYHNQYSLAIQEAERFADSEGYELNPEELAQQVGMGPKKPSEGVTNDFHFHIWKKSKTAKGSVANLFDLDVKKVKPERKMLHVQVYGMGNGKYELNCYIA